MIPKSTAYALVMNGTVVAKGSKKDILSRRKKEGGQILLSPSSKVGDSGYE
jgi:hypothetical protein